MDAVGPAVPLSPVLLAAVALAALIVLVTIVVLIALRRGRRKPEPLPVDLRIDVTQLPLRQPPEEGPTLEFYGMPVRLVALVLAPAGRNAQLPSPQRLAGVLDDLVPGFAAAVLEHRPLLRQWPNQLSTQGFIHAFFNNVKLPGDRGKGTPWCCAAGRFDTGDQQLLAGVLCSAQKPNSLSQVSIANVGQWMEVLRVKT